MQRKAMMTMIMALNTQDINLHRFQRNACSNIGHRAGYMLTSGMSSTCANIHEATWATLTTCIRFLCSMILGLTEFSTSAMRRLNTSVSPV